MREADRRAIYDRDDGHCGFCSEPVAYEEMELAHIHARSPGGATVAHNLRPAHRRCNFLGGQEVKRTRVALGLPPAIRVLNIRRMDGELHRRMRIECIERGLTMTELLDLMWAAYVRVHPEAIRVA